MFAILQNPGFFILTFGMLGLIVGSFLNVVIYRLPQMLYADWREQCDQLLKISEKKPESKINLYKPRSHCPKCKHTIAAIYNIPVLSYLFRKGKCAYCGGKISWQYPVVELFSAGLAIIVILHYGVSWQAIAGIILTWALIPLIVIDVKEQLLPDIITVPLIWIGLWLSLVPIFTDPQSAIIGGSVGYISLWTINSLFRLVMKKDGMGYGDFKLFAVFGVWLGWQPLLFIILLSSVLGALVGFGLILFKKHKRDNPIPFGPFLAVAGWIAMLWNGIFVIN